MLNGVRAVSRPLLGLMRPGVKPYPRYVAKPRGGGGDLVKLWLLTAWHPTSRG